MRDFQHLIFSHNSLLWLHFWRTLLLQIDDFEILKTQSMNFLDCSYSHMFRIFLLRLHLIFLIEISLMFAKVAVIAFRSKLFNENSISINRFEWRMLKKVMTATFWVSESTALLLAIVFLNISFFKLKFVVVFSNILFLTL